jgi:hypothetical protein
MKIFSYRKTVIINGVRVKDESRQMTDGEVKWLEKEMDDIFGKFDELFASLGKFFNE